MIDAPMRVMVCTRDSASFAGTWYTRSSWIPATGEIVGTPATVPFTALGCAATPPHPARAPTASAARAPRVITVCVRVRMRLMASRRSLSFFSWGLSCAA